MSKRATGILGEDLACQALTERGCAIVERNWRCRHGEVDVIARDGNCWVFAEVKARRGRRVENPEEAVSPRKIARLADLAATYLCDHDLVNADWRIDLIAIELDAQGRIRTLNVTKALVAR